jgi:hypothetical protein
MQISGNSADLFLRLQHLDFHKFVDLTADLLAVRGHSNLRITDGPGDGCRDIHSTDKYGNKHLTQCKFHEDRSKTASSLETGQLPLGLVKFGYKNGTFVTNAKVSPQAKREFLNDYPGYSMSWIQGDDLAREVFDSLLLRALWYDGESVDRITFRAAVPILVRDLVRDKPISLQVATAIKSPFRIRDGDLEVEVTLREASLEKERFSPYRTPNMKTRSEGWHPWGRIVEASISGVLPLAGMESVIKVLGDTLTANLTSCPEWTYPLFAMRLGRPYITPLGGESAGTRQDLPIDTTTSVTHQGSTFEEFDWLLPGDDSGWVIPQRISASIADWVRWYHPQLDVCLNLELLSPPDDTALGSVAERQAYSRKWWNESLFALVDPEVASRLESEGVCEPTEVIEWYGGQQLLTWLHGNLEPGFRPLLEEPEDGTDPLPNPFEADSETSRAFFEDLEARLESFDVTIIAPEKARHMIACIRADPFPELDLIYYRPVDLICHWGTVPSPVDPRARHFEFVCVWMLSGKVKGGDIEDWGMLLETMMEELSHLPIEKWFIDVDTLFGDYLIIHLLLPVADFAKDTDAILADLQAVVENSTAEIHQGVTTLVPTAQRATGYFWQWEIGVLFEHVFPSHTGDVTPHD